MNSIYNEACPVRKYIIINIIKAHYSKVHAPSERPQLHTAHTLYSQFLPVDWILCSPILERVISRHESCKA